MEMAEEGGEGKTRWWYIPRATASINAQRLVPVWVTSGRDQGYGRVVNVFWRVGLVFVHSGAADGARGRDFESTLSRLGWPGEEQYAPDSVTAQMGDKSLAGLPEAAADLVTLPWQKAMQADRLAEGHLLHLAVTRLREDARCSSGMRYKVRDHARYIDHC
ncbi:hypothetical protein K402DRAFT_221961 [Aulographum hederae CBS 113979]|uniref:Uncharacterized protein n=1 Tax=Aulographum hederae CBS 113979 TaxID=1176131 RepID=A0A6G1GLQ2_9PEZI|nr:hypothetical protein K402DRAFT_221961 [Aulographum hederae CBS 113979]